MVPQLNKPRPEVSPELKRLLRAIIDAIDACTADDEVVWLECLSFVGEWEANLRDCRRVKDLAQSSEETLERANVFYLLAENRITDQEATRALQLLEERQANYVPVR